MFIPLLALKGAIEKSDKITINFKKIYRFL